MGRISDFKHKTGTGHWSTTNVILQISNSLRMLKVSSSLFILIMSIHIISCDHKNLIKKKQKEKKESLLFIFVNDPNWSFGKS